MWFHLEQCAHSAAWRVESTFLHLSESDRCRWCFRLSGVHFWLIVLILSHAFPPLVRRSRVFRCPRCTVLAFSGVPGAPFITFSGVPGAARRPYSIFQVPCWGLKILLSGIGSHTSAPRLEVQNFNPKLFPARRSPPPFI